MSPNNPHNEAEAPRLRLKKTVDLSKADPQCDRCGGTGIKEYVSRELPQEGLTSVPVVCRCVTRNNGIQPDVLDRMMAEMAQEVHTGSWARALASDILQLPPPMRDRALKSIAALTKDLSKNQTVRDTIKETVSLIEQGIAEQARAEG